MFEKEISQLPRQLQIFVRSTVNRFKISDPESFNSFVYDLKEGFKDLLNQTITKSEIEDKEVAIAVLRCIPNAFLFRRNMKFYIQPSSILSEEEEYVFFENVRLAKNAAEYALGIE